MAKHVDSSVKNENPSLEKTVTRTINLNGKTYSVVTSPIQEIGYYEILKDTKVRLTNFVIMISKQIEEDDHIFFSSSIILDNGEEFQNRDLHIESFLKHNFLRTQVLNKLGIKTSAHEKAWKLLPVLAQESSRTNIEFVKTEFEDPASPTIKDYLGDIDFKQNEKDDELYIVTSPKDLYGYYHLSELGCTRISHFIVYLNEQIRIPDGESISLTYFAGKIVFPNDEEFIFDKLDIEILVSSGKLKNFIMNLCGYESINHSVEWSSLSYFIINSNKDIVDTVIKRFGYDETKDQYVTENLLITKDSITEIRNPMSYEELFGTSKLAFTLKTKTEVKKLKKDIRKKLLDWDSPEVMMTSLAFTMLPIIYPYLKDLVPNKFFLMLQGPSGAGKSLVAKWMQRFYGKFDNLLSWTSTEASINYAGHIMKDALMVVDDFKRENFSTATEIKNAMRTFQNYSDGTGRLRANGLNKISKEKIIQGFLMLSAEDIVVTQTSTLARGIVVEVDSKETRTKEVSDLNELSKDFSAITADYIQYVMTELDEDYIRGLYDVSKFLDEVAAISEELSYDNQARMIQNFALLQASWLCFRPYLFDDRDNKSIPLDGGSFFKMSQDLFLRNFKRVNDKTSYLKFTEAMWDLAESNPNTFVPIENWIGWKNGAIGCYELLKDDKGVIESIILVIKLNEAYKKINSYLSSQGGIGTSPETLEQQLRSKGLIPKTSCGVVAIPKKKSIRGEKWIGDYPKHLFVDE